MRASSKVLLITGLAVGYVLGARAGRQRYDQIADAVSRFWHSPRVQKQVDRSVDFVNTKAERVADIAATGAKNVVGRVTGGAAGSSSSSGASAKSAASAASTTKA